VTVEGQNGSAGPTVLFVLGMARSGTSALTRVLSLCGGALPTALAGANSANPLGYWEPRKAIIINELILRRLGSSRFDPTLRLQEEGAIGTKEKAACIAEIQAYLGTLPAAPLVVIKDPRINVLTDLWFEAARLAGFDVATVISVRHPQEVIASVAAQIQVSPEFSSALWLKATLLAERHTRGLPRVFVEYASLLEDWRREVKRISAALEIDLTTRDDDAIEEFLRPNLRRQRSYSPVTEPFGTDWISTVYDAQCAAARDEPWDEPALDAVYEAYRGSEHGFRKVFEDSHRFDKLSRLVHPSVMKLIYDVLAVVNRRDKTWA